MISFEVFLCSFVNFYFLISILVEFGTWCGHDFKSQNWSKSNYLRPDRHFVCVMTFFPKFNIENISKSEIPMTQKPCWHTSVKFSKVQHRKFSKVGDNLLFIWSRPTGNLFCEDNLDLDQNKTYFWNTSFLFFCSRTNTNFFLEHIFSVLLFLNKTKLIFGTEVSCASVLEQNKTYFQNKYLLIFCSNSR